MNTYGKDRGLTLSRYDFYPPLLGDEYPQVTFRIEDSEPVTFDYTLNGEAGEVAGVTFYTFGNRGDIKFTREFIAQYAGPWPALMEIHARREGVPTNSALLQLHDTRSMVVDRCELTLSSGTAIIPPVLSNSIVARPVYYDARNVDLPPSEMLWEILLPQEQPGLEAEGSRIRVLPEALVGKATVLVRERSGVEQTAILTLVPPQDIGLELSQYDLYPPLINEAMALVLINSDSPDSSAFHYDLVINGSPGAHPGVELIKFDTWVISFDKTFIANYAGSWPARLDVVAHSEEGIVAARTLWLHDTREMECTDVDFEFSPSDTVIISQQGHELVNLVARFRDAAGIQLPWAELEWGARLPEPAAGVEVVGRSLVQVGSQATPGAVRVAIVVANGVNRAKVLTLM